MAKLPYYLATCCIVFVCVWDLISCEKYKLCIVDGKSFKKSLKYCPDLDTDPDSKVECVVALDRTDCMRQVLKGKADFSVFSPEDLVTANNEGIQILVTNELRFSDTPYEYEVVAVVDKHSGIRSRHDLKGKKYCHPGYGIERDWSKVLANFFEASVVTQSCDPKLPLFENRIKATSTFFHAACKAGPWVNDALRDMQLKKKYPQLCSLCDNPEKCSMDDKYWGRTGSLYCLTDGAGDVSWSRLDDVQSHFGLDLASQEASAEDYYLLCPDDTLMPLNASNPCVWVVKPWPVVATRRSVADDIQKIVSTLKHTDRKSWRYNLLMLLESSYVTLHKLPEINAIESYLDHATGFLSANSFSGCHPPRTITICTTSVIEATKCSWIRESATVYGIEPDLECIKADNKTHCMMAVNQHLADVVLVSSDQVHLAQKKYNLSTLFYETVSNDKKYLTVAVVKPDSGIKKFEDLRGKKACFPVYDGVAWNTVKNTMFNRSLISTCSLDDDIASFFGSSCVPGTGIETLEKICEDDFDGEYGALHCLISGKGDVAFVSQNSISNFILVSTGTGASLSAKDLEILCEHKDEPCHLSWSPIGHGMIRANSTELWKKDTLDVFLQLDELFGRNYQPLTDPITLFGRYDDVPNLVFHDDTQKLRPVPNEKENDPMPRLYDSNSYADDKCIPKNGGIVTVSFNLITILFIAFLVQFLRY